LTLSLSLFSFLRRSDPQSNYKRENQTRNFLLHNIGRRGCIKDYSSHPRIIAPSVVHLVASLVCTTMVLIPGNLTDAQLSLKPMNPLLSPGFSAPAVVKPVQASLRLFPLRAALEIN
jgi:hypothetical protein